MLSKSKMDVVSCCTFLLGLISLLGETRADPDVDRLTSQRRASPPQFQNFDDYLLQAVPPPEHNDVLKAERPASGNTTQAPNGTGEVGPNGQTSTTYGDILGYFREVPREHWSCCMLGMLAGNKGFHCHAGFYASRINRRNYNRAHNRRMPFHGSLRVEHYGRHIMHTFSRCVVQHAQEFHRCCYAASVERQERIRWDQFRHLAAGSG